MRVLVTGGLGAVGSVLVRELRQRGNDVWLCDLSHHHDAQYVRCDVGEFRQVERLFAQHDFEYVYHLAAEFCLLYTSDAADERSSVDLGGRRIIKKKNQRDPCGRQ